MKKLWYEIQVECIKYNSSCNMLVGEKNVVAKVKSEGLAYSIATHLKDVYKSEYFNITIK